jgi:hypothetical protein
MSKDIPFILNIAKLGQSHIFQDVCMYLDSTIGMMQIEKLSLYINGILVNNYY